VDIEIDQNSRIPLYLQIEESIKRLIAEGQIKKGYSIAY